MNILHNFDFDIVIGAVLASGLLIGILGGAAKQLRRTLTSVLPLVLVLLLMEPIDAAVASWSRFEVIYASLISFLKLAPFMRTIRTFLVGGVVYVVCFLLIRLISRLMEGRVLKRTFETVPHWSRVVGAALSVVNSYILLTLLLIFAGSCLTLSYSTPLTSAFTSISVPSYSLSQLAEYENINPGYEEELSSSFSSITGSSLAEEYESYLAFTGQEDVLNARLVSLEARLSEKNRQTLHAAVAVKGDLLHAACTPAGSLILIETFDLTEQDEVLASSLARHEPEIRIEEVAGGTDLSTIDLFYAAFTANQDKIVSRCARAESRERLSGLASKLEYLNKNRATLETFFGDVGVDSLADYISHASEAFATEENVAVYANRFLANEEFSRNDDAAYVMARALKRFLKERGNYSLLPSGLAFSVKMTLLPSARDWYTSLSWEKSAFLKAYLSDALSSKLTPGHELYTDYLFSLLFPSLPEVTEEDIEQAFTALYALVADGTLDLDCARAIVLNQFTDDDSLFYRAYARGTITREDLAVLAGKDLPLVTADVKEWINALV